MSKNKWSKSFTEIEIDNSIRKVPSISPKIISVSRSTDIPAFYSDWFISRLKKGYSIWLNPMNQRAQIVNFENVKFIVFWTKDASPMIQYLNEIDNMNIKYYFQFTVNDYETEGFEPNLPPLIKRIETFTELSNKIGKDKVIWRFDPLILSDELSIDSLINKIEKIGDILYPYTEKLVISFVDINLYKRVRRNLDNANFQTCREFSDEEMMIFSKKLSGLNEKWGLKIATCGEIVDLSKFGIEHNRCIDPELMKKICYDDDEFLKFILEHSYKDKGQRNFCGCMSSKDIGQYNTCLHQCIYCYANHFTTVVKNNYRNHLLSKDSPTINGSRKWESQFPDEEGEQTSLDSF